MMTGNLALVLIFMSFTGAGNEPATMFYVVPDSRGKVGEVIITNKAGTATLNKPNETIAAPGNDRPFSESREATAEEIEKRFKTALEAIPVRSTSFNIYFDKGSSEPTPESRAAIEQASAAARNKDARDITLEVYNDQAGNETRNIKLNQLRADKVRQLLLNQKIRPEYITVKYRADAAPQPTGAAEAPDSNDRRVEIVVR
jgi:outer membrane protein OmpA-like peptidoglycan-associated protein